MFASFSPDIQPNITFFREIISIGSETHKTSQSSHIRQKNEENSKKWQNFDEIWDIKVNLGILIAVFLSFHLLFISCKYMFGSFWAAMAF